MLGKVKRLVSSLYATEKKIDAVSDAIHAQTEAIVGAVNAIPSHPQQAPQSTAGTILALSDLIFASERRDPKHIVQTPTHFFSQNYEDAIISEIFSRIGERSKFFVEIGVESGAECNTRFLLDQGWSGVWIEGNAELAKVAERNMASFIESGRLKIVTAMVTADNIQPLLDREAGSREIDFFSLDIDYNNSHVWRAVTSKYRVACLEYNAAVPPSVRWEVEHDEERWWQGDNQFGASLKVYEEIGKEKGMSLVGCDFHGVNAFFVENSECQDKFLSPFTAEKHHAPPRYHLVSRRGHPARLEH